MDGWMSNVNGRVKEKRQAWGGPRAWWGRNGAFRPKTQHQICHLQAWMAVGGQHRCFSEEDRGSTLEICFSFCRMTWIWAQILYHAKKRKHKYINGTMLSTLTSDSCFRRWNSLPQFIRLALMETSPQVFKAETSVGGPACRRRSISSVTAVQLSKGSAAATVTALRSAGGWVKHRSLGDGGESSQMSHTGYGTVHG